MPRTHQFFAAWLWAVLLFYPGHAAAVMPFIAFSSVFDILDKTWANMERSGFGWLIFGQPQPVHLSEESFERIGDIVGEKIDDALVQQWMNSARALLDNRASYYYNPQNPDDVLLAKDFYWQVRQDTEEMLVQMDGKPQALALVATLAAVQLDALVRLHFLYNDGQHWQDQIRRKAEQNTRRIRNTLLAGARSTDQKFGPLRTRLKYHWVEQEYSWDLCYQQPSGDHCRRFWLAQIDPRDLQHYEKAAQKELDRRRQQAFDRYLTEAVGGADTMAGLTLRLCRIYIKAARPGEEPAAGICRTPDLNIFHELKWTRHTGGAGGTSVDRRADPGAQHRPTGITLRSGKLVDRLCWNHTTPGAGYCAGGEGGRAQTLDLEPGEYIRKAFVSTSRHGDDDVISYLHFVTSRNRHIRGGRPGQVTSFSAPGYEIIGARMRGGRFLDGLSLVFKKLPAGKEGSTP